MSRQSQDQTNEQLHIEDAAAAQEEYSLEDIMNEFGGWSKKPEEPEKSPEPEPEKLDEFTLFVAALLKRMPGDLTNRKVCNEFLDHLPDDGV